MRALAPSGNKDALLAALQGATTGLQFVVKLTKQTEVEFGLLCRVIATPQARLHGVDLRKGHKQGHFDVAALAEALRCATSVALLKYGPAHPCPAVCRVQGGRRGRVRSDRQSPFPCAPCVPLRVCRCMLACSLYGNCIGDEGASVIASALPHVTTLTTLEYAAYGCCSAAPSCLLRCTSRRTPP